MDKAGLRLISLFLMLIPYSLAYINPKTILRAQVKVSSYWVISLDPDYVTELKVETFLPFGARDSCSVDPQQEVEELKASTTYKSFCDDFGNSKALFEFSDPLESEVRIDFSYELTIDSLEFYKRLMQTEASNQEYVSSSTYCDLTDAEIARVTQEIAALSSSDWEFLAMALEWVHNNVEYEPSYIVSEEEGTVGDLVMDASWVIRNRKGVCDEFSHLLLCILRKAGIPARFVSGFAFSGDKWAPHAWVEAYVDGHWIPLDPTFNEALLINASHIKISVGRDQSDVMTTIRETRISSGGRKTSASEYASHEFITYSNAKDLPYELEFNAPSKVKTGDVVVIRAKLKNKSSFPLLLPLELSVPKECKVLGYKDRMLFLARNSEVEIDFNVLMPSYDVAVQKYGLGSIVKIPVKMETIGISESREMILEFEESEVSKIQAPLVKVLSVEQTGPECILALEVQNMGTSDLNGNVLLEFDRNSIRIPSFVPVGEKERYTANIWCEESIELKIYWESEDIKVPFGSYYIFPQREERIEEKKEEVERMEKPRREKKEEGGGNIIIYVLLASGLILILVAVVEMEIKKRERELKFTFLKE